VKAIRIISRIATRFLEATRPIPLDKKAIKQLAEDLAKQVANYAAKQPHQDMLMGNDSKVLDWTWKTTTVTGRPVQVYGYFYSKYSKSPSLIIEANVRTADLLEDGEVSLGIGLNGSLPMSAFTDADDEGAKGLKYLINYELVHELTHVAEFWFIQKGVNQVDQNDQPKDMKGYYNSPHEVRAFMQQILDEIMPKARGFRRIEPKNNHAFVTKLMNTSNKWKQISPHLNSMNEAKIIKAVYTALTEAGHIY